MIIIDTNVLSELMRAEPSPQVRAWTDDRDDDELWTTTICAMELLQGVEFLPPGSRRSKLEAKLDLLLHEDFAGRICEFDFDAAHAAAKIAADRRRRG